MLLTTKRIIKAGFVNFWRNSFVSLASIIVMVITLFVIGALIFVNAMLEASLETIRDKVDVNVYFATDAPEESMLAIRDAVEGLPQVERVAYVSREQALANFEERHADDAVSLQALEELDENPLRASLRIKATEPELYEEVVAYLEEDAGALSAGGGPIIDEVNFRENQEVIDNLIGIINSMERFGLAVTITLIVASILITFNTVRLAIYTSRDEIAVMRLVGASHTYIRGPFVFEGIMYGIIAALITLVAFYPLTLYLADETEAFFGNINIFVYYTEHFGSIFLTIMGAGIVLGAVSSFLAVKKYLKL
ncbi:FtsX-like permease family protein [Patescibacteria group bacterium]|jgi:cell division transport system permease protein|nr:FtsX-like permease family protein [Patescibacteria group bacterium]